MLNLKKVIALVCVFALALSTVAFGATYADVAEESAYYEAVETLNKLGIVTGYEDGTYKPEAGVTRAEMAALIARIQGYGETAKGAANTAFTDVPASHWASGYVASAAGMGIINGYGDGTFGPDDQVLYEQAVKMIMATLGFTPFAEKNGGYPTGYLAAAQRYDVTDGVSNAAVGAAANRGTIAQLLENAVEAPLMIQNGWNSTGEVSYTIADTDDNYKTLLSENLGYIKFRGVVAETPVAKFDGDKEIDTTADAKVRFVAPVEEEANGWYVYGNQTLDTYEFLTAGLDVDGFLGQAVTGYAKKLTNGEYELLSIAVDTIRTSKLEIALDQLTSAGTEEVKYLKKGAEKSTAIAVEGLVVVANNALYDGTLDDLMFDDEGNNLNKDFGGKITFISNDDDKAYEVAIVEIAGTAVVDEAVDGAITLMADAVIGTLVDISTITVDEEDETAIVKIFKNGEEIKADALAKFDLLSVIADEDQKVIYAEVMTNTVVGTVAASKTSKTSHEGVAYKIGGVWYDLAANANYADDAIENGVGGTFYIDKYGKIAAFTEDDALVGGLTKNFGYILDQYNEDNGRKADTVVVELLTANGIETLTVKKNAKLDGEIFYSVADHDVEGDCASTCQCAAAAITALDAAIAEGGKVVMYTKTADGELNTVDFADGDKLTMANLDNEDTEEVVETEVTGDYDAEDSEIGSVAVDADAKIFYIDEEDYTLSTIGTLAALEDKLEYTIKAVYATDKAEDNDIIVIDAADLKKAGATSSLAIITAIGDTFNADEEPVYVISYMIDGEAVEDVLTTADVKDAFEDGVLTIGDVVKVKNINGVATSIELVYNFGATVRTVGTAVEVDGQFTTEENVTVYYAETSGVEEFVGGKVEAYNKSNNKATIAGTPDIRLAQAKNTYVIDVNSLGDVTVAKGSYKYFSAIYGENDANVRIKKGEFDEVVTVEDAMAAADYVYVRKYDDKVVDVVIVRGITSATKSIADPTFPVEE